MVTTLNICPQDVDICITRGDTAAWTFSIKDSAGAAVNITGFSFLLTVDPEADPLNATNNLFQLTGTITNGPGGIVEFSMSALQADQTPAVYYFDLQMTDLATKIRTVAKGKFEFKQDITK
jgi:hypothetical protein